MTLQESEPPGWLATLLKLWPFILALVGLIWAAIELRVRKIIRASIEETRREFQAPIGEIGIETMEATKKVEEHDSRIKELETKVAIFWRMVERRTGDLLGKDKDE